MDSTPHSKSDPAVRYLLDRFRTLGIEGDERVARGVLAMNRVVPLEDLGGPGLTPAANTRVRDLSDNDALDYHAAVVRAVLGVPA